MAQQTMQILEVGSFALPNGATVSLVESQLACEAATRQFRPEELDELRTLQTARLAALSGSSEVIVELHNETTLQGIAALAAAGATAVAALNFASANNPGGGFLSGSQAQEESLARSSGLHGSLMKAWSFYEHHRAQAKPVYTDALILSPDCPVFRDDEGDLLTQPMLVSFISGAAPNAGTIAKSMPQEQPNIPAIFARRAANVFALAALHEYRQLVLGAWGCGVFRNDPAMVAETFARLLFVDGWVRCFERVRFAVLDTSPAREVLGAFEAAILPHARGRR
jgi:uncharacterized protein (TIGR02452 family)